MAGTSSREPDLKLSRVQPQPEALELIPEAMARRYAAVPIEVFDHTLRVAMANPSDIFAIEALATQSQRRIEVESASPEEVQQAIDFNYKAYDEIQKQVSNISFPSEGNAEQTAKPDQVSVSDTPIARALRMIIDEGIKAGASDIHIQPQEDRLRVRYRIDGTLSDMLSLPVVTAAPLISRIKVLASMNIADHHRPQDGQFTFRVRGKLIDIRVGTISTVYGEMATLRLLDKSQALLALPELGFLSESLERYQKMLRVPYGMMLVSGPTGAGKTTTLYASINQLDCVGRNIITIEDPVEYRFKNINQIQVNPRAGITFASGLRSILRLDPNVILVGEVRDVETATIAIQSALTGHLVLSSIHANDAASALLRLLDLNIEPFLVSSALVGVVAQRMVRRVCPDCARLAPVSVAERMHYARAAGEEREQFLIGGGCKSCSGTGYRGRTGIFEILLMSEKIRSMVIKGAQANEIRAQAIREGMLSLMHDGMLKVKAGTTTPAEVVRNAYSIEEG